MNAKQAHSGNDDLEAIKADLKRLQADVAELARTLQSALGGEAAGEAGGAAAAGSGDEASGDEWAELREKLEAARASGEEAARELRREVEAHPLASLGVAFGAGYLLARLFR